MKTIIDMNTCRTIFSDKDSKIDLDEFIENEFEESPVFTVHEL